MLTIFKEINKKIDGIVWSFTGTGMILILLAVLIVWTEFVLRIVVGLFVLLIAYTFLFSGYKIWRIKEDIKKHLNI